MAQLFEAVMVISFGISWPTSIIKSYTSRTAKGKSIVFLCFILIGYIFGVASKFLSGNLTYVVAFYILNLVMVSIDLCLYFRNRKLDQRNERGEAAL
jgi:lipopolysaccharide export LptBFGC system permease protein LptF